ncbi:MAG: FkbM family methyltransferase [Salibacteraceae bacterium]|nr:FkbM family methyltransferase [Salibacteraceae bacterium]
MKQLKEFFKLLYKRLVFWLSASNNPVFILGYKWFYHPKTGTISVFLDRLSKSRKVFVFQVGANDGITHDPIHKFVKRDQWSGILLEPQKYVFEKFLKPIYAKNKGVIPVNAAIGYEDGEATLYRIAFSNKRWATGLASFDKSSLQALFDDGTILKRTIKTGETFPKEASNQIAQDQIKTYSPSSLINQYQVTKIDLLMIDAEGFDFEVIKMFDMNLVKPASIIFERTHLSAEERKECDDLLTRHGYQFKDINANTLAWQPELNAIVE